MSMIMVWMFISQMNKIVSDIVCNSTRKATTVSTKLLSIIVKYVTLSIIQFISTIIMITVTVCTLFGMNSDSYMNKVRVIWDVIMITDSMINIFCVYFQYNNNCKTCKICNNICFRLCLRRQFKDVSTDALDLMRMSTTKSKSVNITINSTVPVSSQKN